MRKKTAAFVLIAAFSLGITTFAGSANAAPLTPDSVQYVAGGANAQKPTYDPSTGMLTWKCVFNGWAGVSVNSTCSLTLNGTTVSSHSKTFTGPQYSTALFYNSKVENVTYCTVAYAIYANGSDSDTTTRCQ